MKILLLIIFSLPSLGFSQEIFNFLSPMSPITTLDIEGAFYPNSKIEDDLDKTQIVQSSVAINQKVFEREFHTVSLGARWQKLDLNARSKVLKDYHNQQGNLVYKRTLSADKFWLASIGYGSASDRPFRDSRDSTLSVNYIRRLGPKWFVAGNYSNNRTFLNNIPLPGFFYVKEMSRERSFIIGFPFLLWNRPLHENWSIRYFGLLPWVHNLRILYSKWGWVKPFIGIEQSPQSYFRNDREERRDRFFWFERKLVAGVEQAVNKNLRFELAGGWAFDRQFFEAENFSEKKELFGQLGEFLFCFFKSSLQPLTLN